MMLVPKGSHGFLKNRGWSESPTQRDLTQTLYTPCQSTFRGSAPRFYLRRSLSIYS